MATRKIGSHIFAPAPAPASNTRVALALTLDEAAEKLTEAVPLMERMSEEGTKRIRLAKAAVEDAFDCITSDDEGDDE